MRFAAIVGTLSLTGAAACGGRNGSDMDGGRATDVWHPSEDAFVGACRPGTQTCDCSWGECIGAIVPVAETCDGTDEDCDGSVDEGICP